ncbi:hypothetical protein C1H46_019320 [Malus baccata]|uniref:Uncharacterized protein n=1 Tax=Malus baccata TaxID=106549 RepID=A0A540M928_MALBA|nr:hypothetical protein C1H46_019320 [Malus baccata]
MGSKENNPALVRPSNYQGPQMWGSKFVKEVGPNPRPALRDVHNITTRECPRKDVAECKKNVQDLLHRPVTRRFAQLLQQHPKVVPFRLITRILCLHFVPSLWFNLQCLVFVICN